MTTKEEYEEIKKKVFQYNKWEPYPEYPKNSGGQSCGIARTGATLINEEVGFKCSIEQGRSQLKNKEMLLMLLEFYLLETKVL